MLVKARALHPGNDDLVAVPAVARRHTVLEEGFDDHCEGIAVVGRVIAGWLRGAVFVARFGRDVLAHQRNGLEEQRPTSGAIRNQPSSEPSSAQSQFRNRAAWRALVSSSSSFLGQDASVAGK